MQQTVLLHLSDIHFNKESSGGRYDPDDDLRNELDIDAQRMLEKLGTINGILVTGDVAYAAQKEEYEIATSWLNSLCHKLNCQPENVWTIPGNHDIDRSVIQKSRTLQIYRKTLRDCTLGSLDEEIAYLMKDEIARKAIFQPLENYNKFAAQFSCNIDADNPTWHQDIALNDGSQLRILGLNSVLVSDRFDDSETNKMVLGASQSLPKRIEGVEYITLCHHPLDWLRDADNVHAHFTDRVRLQLFGHKHSQRVDRIGDTVRLTAGAVHPYRGEGGWKPRYNVIVLSVDGSDGNRNLGVTIYPRVWSEESLCFIGDYGRDGLDFRFFSLPLLQRKINITETSPEKGKLIEEAAESAITRVADVIIDSAEEALDLSDAGAIGGASMNKARRLTYRFMNLPYHMRLKIAQDLGLLRDEDEGVDDALLFPRLFDRAKEGNLLSALWEEVENAYGDDNTDNPFSIT
jgi:3',5'-cyclic AMP phosphodiesterase CpdA